MSNHPEGELVARERREVLFQDVHTQLHRLHRHWRLYVTFFGSREASAVVQRESWRFTFGNIQDLLIDSIALNLNNLLAGPKSSGAHQASIEQLLEHLPTANETFVARIQTRLTLLRAQCAAFKARRDRVIAHRDRAVVLEEASLDPMSIGVFRNALQELSHILEDISEAYYSFRRSCPFEPDTAAEPFDADVLIEKLRALPE